MPIKKIWGNIWAASEVYAFCAVGAVLSVFLDLKTATLTTHGFSWARLGGAFGIAFLITAGFEAVGTKEGKRRNLLRRGAMAILLGFFGK